ncbi:MAG: cytochrome P450, partial [Actinomycetota bacterium]|nr:cytochrome P450 [Actinomycetota bacterium]
MTDAVGFLTRCAREYGDMVWLKFPGPPAYLLAHPDYIEQVLVGNNRNFIKDRITRSQLSILGDGLLASDGAFW